MVRESYTAFLRPGIIKYFRGENNRWCENRRNEIERQRHSDFVSQFIKTKYFDPQDHSEGGINWMVLPANYTDEECWKIWSDFGMPMEVNIYSDYDCTGRYFARGAYIIRTKTRVLIKQMWGYDI